MTRVLTIFVFFFNFHVSVRLFVLLGLGLIVLGNLVGNPMPPGWLSQSRLTPMGTILLMMPVLWTSSAFRQLASNRSLTLVPGFRVTAIAAYFLVAVAVGLVGWFSISRFGADAADVPRWLGLKVFAITFALISLFLLVAQWACTLRRGMFVQLGLIIVLLNGFVRDVDLTMLLAIEGARPLGWFVAALLGWMLLFLALRRGVIAGPVPSQSIERMSGGNQKSFELGLWQPSFGGAGEPDGSLMRGSNDSLGTRVWQAGIWVLFLSSLMVTFGLLTRNPMLGARGPGITPLFVGASLMSVAVLAPLTLAEWPARLRFLWLRSDGDRGALWSRLERALLEQTVIVTAVAAAAATLLMAVADGDVGLLLAYVAGCAVALPFGGYLGFWLRGRALSFNVFGFVQMLIWTAAFWMAFFLYRSHGVMGLVPLIAGIGVLGVLWRQLAQRQFRGVDWCAVRPVRQRDSRLFPGRRA